MRYARYVLPTKTRTQAYFYLLINTIIWGAALIVVKPAFESTTPFRFLFYRFLVASLVSLPIIWHFWRKKILNWEVFFKVSAIELIGTTLTLGLVYLGLERTSAIEASLIATTAPLFTILLGIIFLKERQERKEWLGLGLSFVGMIILALLPILRNDGLTRSISIFGNVLIIAANIAESIYFISAKKAYKSLPKFLVASIGFVVGAVTFGVMSLWQQDWSVSALVRTTLTELQISSVLFAVLYMSILGSLIALTAYIKGQDKIEASEASLFRYLQPAIYLPLGVIFLKEMMFPLQFVGLTLILLGVWWAEVRKR